MEDQKDLLEKEQELLLEIKKLRDENANLKG